MVSLAAFGKRFCRRVIRDLPEDLEAMECEDALGILRHHVPRLIDGVARPTGARQAAYARRPLFGIPGSPPYSRLRSASGDITFHFAKNVVEGRTARAFDDYAVGKERDHLPGQEAGRSEEAEVSLDGAFKDAYMHGHGGQNGGPATGWTNLGHPSEWDRIEAIERDGRANPDGNPPGVNIFYDRAPALFDELSKQTMCPAGLRKLIEREQVRVAAGRQPSKRKACDGVRWTDERAFDTYSWIKAQPHWPEHADKNNRPARVSKGRPVQTHLAGEGEYYADLDQAARGRIRAGMIDVVQRQRNPGSEADDSWFVPMTICDHAASGLNDPLNDHFHWLIGTRRARYTESGNLEFEQNKVNAITRKGWIDVMRQELARLANVELSAIGADVRYHPGTLSEMGIDAIAQEKMHGRRTVLERAGVSTDLGLSNDAEGWRRAFAGAAHDHETMLAALVRDLPMSDVQHPPVRQIRIDAAELRHEAAQIQLLIDMSRSRSARTMRFAPEYAAEATTPRAMRGWLARRDEAERHLLALDSELAPEREGIADRLARAAGMEVEATALHAAQRREIAIRSPDYTTTSRAADMHRAIDIVAGAPLFVEASDGRLFVAERDDPDGLVTNVDLSGAQKRLIGIRAAQQRELAQVQAFARRHGADALFDDVCETHSAWFQDAVRKWRDTPAMHRYLIDRQMIVTAGRERDLRGRGFQQSRRTQQRNHQEDGTELQSLADIPFLGDLAHGEERQAERLAASNDPVSTTAAPSAEEPEIATSKPPPHAIVWSDMERQHRRLHLWREQRERQRTTEAVAKALADRVGGRDATTPYAARLIRKVAEGFDPAGVSGKIGPVGLTLDQRDADEIAVLLRDPGFRAQCDASRQQGAALPNRTSKRESSSTGPNFLGRVGLDCDRLSFGPVAAGHSGPLRTPLEWANQTVALVADRGMLLSRQDGLVGVHDPDVLRVSHYNYLGLLHPSVQHALDAQFRIQAEEERGLLAKVRTGDLKIKVGIEGDRWSKAVTTQVRLIGGSYEAQAFVTQRRLDAGFYFRCREAVAGVPADAPVLRHRHAAVRAWLAARDDGAVQPMIDLLGQAVRKISTKLHTTGMANADAQALTRLLSPLEPTHGHQHRRRGGPRNRLRRHVGRPERLR